MKILAVIGAFAIMILFAFVCGAIIAQQTDDEKNPRRSRTRRMVVEAEKQKGKEK